MTKKFRFFIIVFITFLVQLAQAQLDAPSLRCVSLNSASGDMTLSWVIPPDPTGIFTRYEVYNASAQGGPYTLVGNVNTHAQSSYVHLGSSGNLLPQYYYIVTVSNGTVTSSPSDTIRSLFLTLNNLPVGVAVLNWNTNHTPLLPTASTTYTLSRQTPPGGFVPIYVGASRSYRDTISICSVFYNYKVAISDASGCISESNVVGDLFHDGNAPSLPVLDSVSVNSNGSVTIGWEPSSSEDVVMYYIYKETAGGIWLVIDSVYGYNNTIYTYLGSSANSGSENFCVSALDSCRNVSILGSSQAQKTIFLNSKFFICSRTAELSWTNYVNLIKGVLQYDVYCSINGGASQLIGTSTGNTFTHQNLNPGDSYCYFVRVRNKDKSISASSNVSCVNATAPIGPSFVYLKSVSVNFDQKIEVTYAVDTLKSYRGAVIYKSEDGITFNQLMVNSSNSNFIETIVDTDVSPSDKNYYYKVQLLDSCGNPGLISNISKSIVLKVSHDNERLFYNTLKWDDYSSWLGNVASYNIYRSVNGVYDPVPIGNVSAGMYEYTDNVEDFVGAQGKFSYYVEAVEGPGNTYGFIDKAKSNSSDAYLEVTVYVPNAFAPKGLNNVWLPMAQYVDKTDYKVTVLDRWGTKVFQTSSDTEGWTGNGATDDVYVYMIEYKNARGEYIQLNGHLTLVK